MIRAARQLNKPASESNLGLALVVAAVTMGLMLWGIIWQSNIIVYQRGVIRSSFLPILGADGEASRER